MLRESAVYAAGSLVARLAGFAVLPIYARCLDQPSLGAFAICLALSGLLVTVSGLSLDSAAHRWWWEHPSESERRDTFAVWLRTWTVLGLLAALLLIACHAPITAWLAIPEAPLLVYLTAALVVLGIPGAVLINRLRLQRRAYAGTALIALPALLGALTGILAVGLFAGGVAAALGALVVAAAATSAVAIPALLRHGLYRRGSSQRRQAMLAFALPMLPAALGVWALGWADRLVLGATAGANAVGPYQIAASIAAAAGFLASAIQQAWAPAALAVKDDPRAPLAYADAARLVAFGAGLAIILLGGLAPEIVRIIAGATWSPAAPLVIPLAAAQACTALVTVLAIGPTIAGDGRCIGRALGAGAFTAVLLLWPAATWLGATGVAWTICAGQLIACCWLFLAGLRLGIPYPWLRLGSCLALSLVATTTTAHLSLVPRLIVLCLSLAALGIIALRRTTPRPAPP